MSIRNAASQVREDLQTLRDEIRLQIHLGGMDIKEEWDELEPEVEEALTDAAHDADDAVHELVLRLTALRKRLMS